ncbi:MAG: MBOAT family O-acyltransferase [bacterium]
MLFSTPIFLYGFFPIFFLGYFLISWRRKNAFILAGSLLFYAWGEPIFTFIAIASALADYALGDGIAQTRLTNPRQARWLLMLGVFLNLGLLGYFKYTNFFLKNLCGLLSAFHPISYTPLSILLPLGVSFIIFEKITYLADLYRGLGHPAKKLMDYVTYVFLFPKLLAGPIVKYHDIQDQLNHHQTRREDVAWGLSRFIQGLAKKTLIADPLNRLCVQAFAIPANQLDTRTAWMVLAAFTLQIYFDFSGYSDMAIGMARVMGFRLRENFNHPYLASSFTDFWRRWHISLSTWIKEYLYIPLGGNRGPGTQTAFNLLLCFVLCGLWHGAQWTFVIWGLFHGVFLAIDKRFGAGLARVFPAALQKALTFFLVAMGWVLFRCPSFPAALYFYSRLFNWSHPTAISSARVFIPLNSDYFILGIGFFFILLPAFLPSNAEPWTGIRESRSPRPLQAVGLLALLLLSLIQISASSFNPFIYFRF